MPTCLNEGPFEAINRAVTHCKLVREALLRFRRPHDYREAQNSRPELVGGFTISIDLKRAFDSLPRPQLFDDLRALGVEASCIQLLQEWRVGTRYWIEHKGHHKSVEVQLGVRQGPVPLLFCGQQYVSPVEQIGATHES